jgi:hypothetical protein
MIGILVGGQSRIDVAFRYPPVVPSELFVPSAEAERLAFMCSARYLSRAMTLNLKANRNDGTSEASLKSNLRGKVRYR